MLILTRRLGEVLTLGNNVTITIVGIRKKQIKLGIEAPKHIQVHRKEIFQRIQQERMRCIQSDSIEQAEAT